MLTADPVVQTHCVSALLRANQRWGSRCHAHLSFCFDLFFSTVKLICILHNRSKSLLRMRSGALLGGFIEAHNFASSYPQQVLQCRRASSHVDEAASYSFLHLLIFQYFK